MRCDFGPHDLKIPVYSVEGINKIQNSNPKEVTKMSSARMRIVVAGCIFENRLTIPHIIKEMSIIEKGHPCGMLHGLL